MMITFATIAQLHEMRMPHTNGSISNIFCDRHDILFRPLFYPSFRRFSNIFFLWFLLFLCSFWRALYVCFYSNSVALLFYLYIFSRFFVFVVAYFVCVLCCAVLQSCCIIQPLFPSASQWFYESQFYFYITLFSISRFVLCR